VLDLGRRLIRVKTFYDVLGVTASSESEFGNSIVAKSASSRHCGVKAETFVPQEMAHA